MNVRRRLSDKIIDAHQQACDEGKLEVADALLKALEVDLSAIGGTPGADQRRSTEELEQAYARHDKARRSSGR